METDVATNLTADWGRFLAIIAVCALAVWAERTDKCISRITYFAWVLGAYAVPFMAALFLGGYFGEGGRLPLIVIGIAAAGVLSYKSVQRARDADRGKWLAYLTAVPLLQLLIYVLLIFYPPAPSHDPDVDAERA